MQGWSFIVLLFLIYVGGIGIFVLAGAALMRWLYRQDSDKEAAQDAE